MRRRGSGIQKGRYFEVLVEGVDLALLEERSKDVVNRLLIHLIYFSNC